jgi:phosphoglycerol transferase
MLPFIQNFIFRIIETNVLHRELRDINKWKNYLFSFGFFTLGFFFLTVIYIIVNRQYFSGKIVMDNIRIYFKKELLYCAASGIISLLAVYIILGLHSVDLNVPFSYGGDGLGGLTLAQNLITGNGVFMYPNMGAPSVVSAASSPGAANIHTFGMWILSLFIKEPCLLVNVFYILTFATISIATTVSLRLLKINPMTSIFGGVLYSLLYYHFFRGVGHLFLSTYTIVPLSCVVILWIINGEINFNKVNFKDGNILKNIVSVFPPKTAFSVFIALFIGMSNLYYMFFACLGIVFAIVWNLLEERNFKKIIAPSVILFIVVIFAFFIQILPFVIFILNGNESRLAETRSLRDVEFYTLKFSQLVLPVNGHRFHFFSRIRIYYDTYINNNNNENHASSLGLLMSAGLIISFFIAMKKNDKTHENISIQHSAVLNVFMLLLGSVGGIASLIIIFTKYTRCYNRLSIYIAFFSMYIITYYMDYLSIKFKLRNISKYFIIVIIGILAALDQTGHKKLSNSNLEKYYSDRELIKRIEEITPAGSMVFQLPFVPSNHYINYRAIGAYEQFVPFVHSRSLKWSYRAQQNSKAEKWQRLTVSKSVEEMLKHLAGVGFRGLYVDKFGYLDEEYNVMRNDIIKITGVQPIISINERLEYFYLGEYFEDLKKTFNEQDIFVYTNYEMPPIILPNQILNVQNVFLNTLGRGGWSDFEDWGVWNVGNQATVEFYIVDTDTDLELHATIYGYPNPTNFSVFVNERNQGNYSIPSWEEQQLVIPIKRNLLHKEDGLLRVTIRFEVENPQSPGADPRVLGIGLKSMMLVHPENSE